MNSITIFSTGTPIGMAQSISIDSSYYASLYSVRLNSFNINDLYTIRVQESSKITVLNYARISSYGLPYSAGSFTYLPNMTVAAISMESYDASYNANICKYCDPKYFGTPEGWNHTALIFFMNENRTKESALMHLGIVPENKKRRDKVSIEILQYHYPDIYDKIEKLLLIV